jgi:predicted Fe-Mo cluster-binding NifX family protein
METARKIAIPTKDKLIDDHFGHCEYYTIFEINGNNQLARKDNLVAPEGCGCKSNIASTLKDMGVSILLAGSMGDGAANMLAKHGIKAIRGCKGNAEDAALAYLAGSISDSGTSCQHTGADDGHVCGGR